MRFRLLLIFILCSVSGVSLFGQAAATHSKGLSDSEEVKEIQRLISAHEADSAEVLVDALLTTTSGEDGLQRASAVYLKGDVLHEQFKFKEAVPFFHQAIELSRPISRPLALLSRHMLADSYHFAGQLDSAQYHFRRLLEHDEPKDSIILGLAHYGLYKTNESEGRDEVALRHLYEAHDIYRAQGQEIKSAMLKMYIGVLYHRLDQDSMALSIMQESLDVTMREGHLIGQAFVYLERALIFQKNDRLADSEADILKAIAIADEVGHLGIVADGSETLADLYATQGRHDEAEALFVRSLDLCRTHGIPEGVVSNAIGLARTYMALDRYEDARRYAQEAKDIALTHGYDWRVVTANGLLAQIYYALGDFERAYQARSAELVVSDSIQTIERTAAIGELREKYERAENLNQIASLESQAAIDSLKQKGLMIGLALLAIFSVLIINREVQRKNKAKQLLEAEKQLAENEQRRLQEEIDHKNRELTSNALNMARKNEFLAQLNQQLDALKTKEGTKDEIRGLQNSLKIEKQLENNWEHFATQFTETNPTFYTNLKKHYPTLTPGEQRLAALLKMMLSNKDIAHILNISDDGVKKARYRMRKKIGLTTEESLEELILGL